MGKPRCIGAIARAVTESGNFDRTGTVVARNGPSREPYLLGLGHHSKVRNVEIGQGRTRKILERQPVLQDSSRGCELVAENTGLIGRSVEAAGGGTRGPLADVTVHVTGAEAFPSRRERAGIGEAVEVLGVEAREFRVRQSCGEVGRGRVIRAVCIGGIGPNCVAARRRERRQLATEGADSGESPWNLSHTCSSYCGCVGNGSETVHEPGLCHRRASIAGHDRSDLGGGVINILGIDSDPGERRRERGVAEGHTDIT